MSRTDSNTPSGFLFFVRETSWREALRLFFWHPLICRLRGHRWQEHEWFEEDVPFTPSEHWRMCERCERYEDLMGASGVGD